MDLFSEPLELDLSRGEVAYYPSFFTVDEANHYFRFLKETIPWQLDQIKVFGKTYDQPRLTSLYANNGKAYSYSGITMKPHPFSQELKEIKEKVETLADVDFTTCLLNLYRDGKDSNGWHADDEKELGKNPIIASVSFGAARYFHLRNKEDKTQKHKILLEHGSLLLMKGETQHYWQHQIAKTAKKVGERINLTFRVIH